VPRVTTSGNPTFGLGDHGQHLPRASVHQDRVLGRGICLPCLAFLAAQFLTVSPTEGAPGVPVCPKSIARDKISNAHWRLVFCCASN